MSREVTHDGRGSFRIRFPFDRRLVDLVKTLPSRRWNPSEKYWSVPEEAVVQLVELLHPEGFGFDETTTRIYRDCGGSVSIEPARPAPANPVTRDLFSFAEEEAKNEADRAPAAAGGPDDYTVARLNQEVKAVLERAFPAPIWLVGEISGFNKNAHRRHVTFHLVEREEDGKAVSEINATLFEGTRREITRSLATAGDPFTLEDEVTVRLRVRVELYAPWGMYRVVVDDLDIHYTLGEAARRREEIIRRLTEEGLVGLNTSLPFPALPLRVGLITSLGSDAYNDVMRTLQESGFAFRITAHGARVQGRKTEPSVLNALDWFRAHADDHDLVLICRGGGSRTDLAWFDSEALGRAVAAFPLPVVVGIGHEQDYSVLDAIGWRRKTPTAAAAYVVEEVGKALERVEESGRSILEAARLTLREERSSGAERARRLATAARNLLQRHSTELVQRRQRTARGARALLRAAGVELGRRSAAIPRSALVRIGQERALLEGAARQMTQGARRDIGEAERKITQLSAALGPAGRRRLTLEVERTEARLRRLDLVDPRRVVERGYAILRMPQGDVLTDPESAPAGTRVGAELKGGRLRLRSEGPQN